MELIEFVWTFRDVCKAIGLGILLLFSIVCMTIALFQEIRNKKRNKKR